VVELPDIAAVQDALAHGQLEPSDEIFVVRRGEWRMIAEVLRALSLQPSSSSSGVSPAPSAPSPAAPDVASRVEAGPVPAPTPVIPGPIAGLYPDPAGRHQLRFFDGFRWTDQVSDGGPSFSDPLVSPTTSVPGVHQGRSEWQRLVRAVVVLAVLGGGAYWAWQRWWKAKPVTATQLCDDFVGNPASAEERYKGKRLDVSGIVESVGQTTEETTSEYHFVSVITLRGASAGSGGVGCRIRLIFPVGKDADLLDVTQGDSFSAVCKPYFWHPLIGLDLHECERDGSGTPRPVLTADSRTLCSAGTSAEDFRENNAGKVATISGRVKEIRPVQSGQWWVMLDGEAGRDFGSCDVKLEFSRESDFTAARVGQPLNATCRVSDSSVHDFTFFACKASP
jgi:hypothetical protein